MELLDSADVLQKLKYTAQTEDWVIGGVNADGEKCVGKAYTKQYAWVKVKNQNQRRLG
ncbi:hypothetical protein KBT16_24950 [Nostoc sp. CCCryo 231-06]|nr:hypothetical protein [Nostoc sp. CCCryo 231-06]